MDYISATGVLLFLLALSWLADRFHYDPRPPYPPEEPMSLYLSWKIAQMRLEESQKQAEVRDALAGIGPQSQPARLEALLRLVRGLASRLAQRRLPNP